MQGGGAHAEVFFPRNGPTLTLVPSEAVKLSSCVPAIRRNREVQSRYLNKAVNTGRFSTDIQHTHLGTETSLAEPSSPYLLSATVTPSKQVSARRMYPWHSSCWGLPALSLCLQQGKGHDRALCSTGTTRQAGLQPRRQRAAQSAALARRRGQLGAGAAGHRSCQHCGTEWKNAFCSASD